MNYRGLVSRAAIAIALSSSVTAFAQDSAPQAAATDEGAAIIVTGTRATGVTAAESAAPIKVLDSAMLEKVGQPNLNQVLTQLVPSFTAEAFGGDTANLTLSARLRGLSPNHALVLVNGKRRHGTSNLHVLSGPYQGGAAPDLDMIPPGAIARIEVLEDGAAAQYGSDAIAGVINIILKEDKGSISGNLTAGQYYKGDGDTYSGSITFAPDMGPDTYLNFTMFHRFHDFSQRGGVDSRIYNRDGTLRDSLSDAHAAMAAVGLPGAPYTNRIVGDSRSTLSTIFYNAGHDFGGVEIYAFGSYGRREASAYENYRQPWRVTRSDTLGEAGEDILFSATGFNPREAIKEDDFSNTGGIKGETGGFRWDISTTYGQDYSKLYTLDTANRSLFIDTGSTPSNFYDGFLKATEWTTNLDIAKEIELGLASPANIAFGAEYRENSFSIGKGDYGSTYFEGGQSYPGFLATDAGKHKRNNKAAYLDIALNPIDIWKVDGAVRFEDYSDFGTKWTWKLTNRIDFTEQVAVRGTVSTGFRAPSLLESYYSSTNVGPTSAYVQLPPNSAAAKLLGYDDLKPETSTNFSLGLVLRPIPKLNITLDAYQVKMKNRIVGTGSIVGLTSGEVTNQAVLDAIAAHGNVLDPYVLEVGDAGINLFTNGADTRTRGVDLTASYPTPVGGGSILWSLSANYNTTKITKLRLSEDLYAADARSILEKASPKYKIITGALFTSGGFSVNLRETFYGKASQVVIYGGDTPTVKVGAAALTDLEASYDFGKGFTLTFGANNLFNKKADTVPNDADDLPIDGGAVLDAPVTFSPYGINGGYYYGRIGFKF
ncbi:TonB-dependent receptor plug domain-containing protein [Sphingobium sp. CAP-1]|uniref:TonB-dependent receptor plug domain-containing protein n=1 Tax=Sphingobium sp. CAP-1 TaxID=2676077 RepID=UPI0012BB364E|nr:TonB-dependent receptor [Sphingobium sp. CAP-1]QGP77636.1 TonB-dependent receptor [Sphingobium sp. CAP-1]